LQQVVESDDWDFDAAVAQQERDCDEEMPEMMPEEMYENEEMPEEMYENENKEMPEEMPEEMYENENETENEEMPQEMYEEVASGSGLRPEDRVVCCLCLDADGQVDVARWPLICCTTTASPKWVHRACMRQFAATPVVTAGDPPRERRRYADEICCPVCRNTLPHETDHMTELELIIAAQIVPAPPARPPRRPRAALVDAVVPAFGFDDVPAVDAAIAPVLVQAGMLSVIGLNTPAVATGPSQQQGSLDVLIAAFSGGTCFGRSARRSKYLLICYLNLAASPADVYARLHAQLPSLGRMSVLQRGHTTAVFVIRSSASLIPAGSFDIDGTPPRFEGRLPHGPSRNHAVLKEIVTNWCGYGEFFYNDFVIINNEAADSRPTFDQVQSIMLSLTEAQQARLVGDARITPSAERSPLQRAIVALGEARLRPGALPVNCVWTVQIATRERLLRICQFTGLAAITLTRWCEHTDATITLPFLTYIMDAAHYRRHSLLLLSPPGFGKSPLARSVCFMWAIALAIADGRPAHSARFIECNTIDILRQMTSDCNAHTPILFDEVGLGDATQFQHMSVNTAKLLLSVDVRTTLRARNNDVTLAAGQPRVFTSNESSLLDFVGMGMTDTSPHFKAMRKRIFVGTLTAATVNAATARRPEGSLMSAVDTTGALAGMDALLV
jgi:hypothetical protein